MRGTIRPRHKSVKKELSKDNINDFYMLLDERRDIRWGKVKQMVSALERKEHFEVPLVINEQNGISRMLDGNHRVEALKMFFEKNPDATVIVDIAKYNNYSREKERDVYSTWNKGTPESANDYLKNYWQTIPYGEQLLRQLPVSLERTSDKLSVKLLVTSHISAMKQKRFEGGYSYGGEQTVEDFQSITSNDIKTMKAFISDMQYVFGEPLRKSKYWRSTPVPAFYRIWFDNKETIPVQKIHQAFGKIRDEWERRWEENAKKGGRSACQSFYTDLITTLKETNKRMHWKSDLDLIREKHYAATEEAEIMVIVEE